MKDSLLSDDQLLPTKHETKKYDDAYDTFLVKDLLHVGFVIAGAVLLPLIYFN